MAGSVDRRILVSDLRKASLQSAYRTALIVVSCRGDSRSEPQTMWKWVEWGSAVKNPNVNIRKPFLGDNPTVEQGEPLS